MFQNLAWLLKAKNNFARPDDIRAYNQRLVGGTIYNGKSRQKQKDSTKMILGTEHCAPLGIPPTLFPTVRRTKLRHYTDDLFVIFLYVFSGKFRDRTRIMLRPLSFHAHSISSLIKRSIAQRCSAWASLNKLNANQTHHKDWKWVELVQVNGIIQSQNA